ncbi:MAG TPA: LLM class flavin-dependent oxidoreductase [Stellaceae bacterium]|nr:LLM class flavin-dependent oxidoreductase [Stellaceae bacterium]
MSTLRTGPRFGVWSMNPGTWASSRHPDDPFDASWKRVRAQILRAEQLGYDATLIAQHTLAPKGDDTPYLDAWSSAAALAALTSRIEIITAIKPPLCHPVVLAKQALGIEEISGGRFAINIVNGWFKPELEKTGIGLREHDERYVYGTEWLSVVRSLFENRRTTFHGKYFHLDDVGLSPRSGTRKRPTIYVGGESDPARDLAAALGDVWFINGQPIDEVRRLIASVRERPRTDAPIRFGLSAYVIARPSEGEAQEELRVAWERANRERGELADLYAKVDPKAVMFHTAVKFPHIGTNGGTAAGLVGSYEQVAERIAAFHEIGVDLFMLQFQPFEAEMERFARELFPRVRGETLLAGAA